MSRKHTSTTGKQPPRRESNCHSCSHFYITYDPRFPYGCRAAGFKSRCMPAQEMYKNSGMTCLAYLEKAKER